MTNQAEFHALCLFRASYQPFERLADLVECALRVAVESTRSEFASIALIPVASLRSEPLEASQGVRPDGPVSTVTVPLHFDRQRIGALSLTGRRTAFNEDSDRDGIQALARLIERHICRFLIESCAAARNERDVRLIGTSDRLALVDEFIQKSSSAALPVIIAGAPGSREERIAYALHYAGARRDSALVEIHCATAKSTGIEGRLMAPGESTVDVFLHGIEHLDTRLQDRLAECMETLLARRGTNLRVLATTAADLPALAAAGRFSSTLLRSFDYLQMYLAPLCERTEDIRPLALKFLRKHSPIPRDISTGVLAALESYSWPENVSEVERVMARLAVLADGPCITVDDLHHHVPRVLASNNRAPRPQPAPSTLETRVMDAAALIRALVRGEPPRQLEMLHPALRRALVFLASRSSAHVTLPDLARAANISPSHLASLFRSLLGMTSKNALSLLRAEQAKELMLRNSDTPLGDIAEQLGFQDPRHFQRMFKRVVGCTPSHFRRYKSSDDLPFAATACLDVRHGTVLLDSGDIAHAAGRSR